MDEVTRQLVDRVSRSIGRWHTQLLDSVKPGSRLHDRFFTYDLETSDVPTDDLGKTLNIYISGWFEAQGYEFNHIILTGFFIWVQKGVFDFTKNLWGTFSKELGCFSATADCFAGSEEIHGAFSVQATLFSKTLLQWSRDNYVDGRTKESFYKEPPGILREQRWRIALVISECGVTEDNDGFFKEYFGLSFQEYRHLDSSEAGKRFTELYKLLDVEEKRGVANKWDWAIHAFKLIQLVSSRAYSLGIDINCYPSDGMEEVLRASVKEGLFSASTRRRLAGLLKHVAWNESSTNNNRGTGYPEDPATLRFPVFPGLFPNGRGEYLPMLTLKCRDDEEEGSISIVNDDGKRFVAMHEPDSSTPFCEEGEDRFFTSPKFFDNPSPIYKECSFTPLYNTGARSRPVRLVFPAVRVYFLAKGPFGQLSGVSPTRSALASHIVLPKAFLGQASKAIEGTGLVIEPLVGSFLPGMTDMILCSYSEPNGGLNQEITLPGGVTVGGGASPRLMRFARGLRVRGAENSWFPFDPPIALVLNEHHEPFSEKIVFERVGEEDGCSIWELSPPEGEDFPSEAIVSLQSIETKAKVTDDRFIRFEIESKGTKVARGSLDSFGEWKPNQDGWFGFQGPASSPPNNDYNFEQMPHQLANRYQGEKVEDVSDFPQVWDNIATALRGMGGGFILYRKFCRLLNQYLGISKMGRTRAEYDIVRDYNAMGMVEIESRSDGVPNKMLAVQPTAYLTPWKPNYRFCAVLGGSFNRREVEALAAGAKADHRVDLYFRQVAGGYNCQAYPPTVSITCASIVHLNEFLAGCGINFSRVQPAEALGRFQRGLPLVFSMAFQEKNLGGTYVRPTGIKCLAYDPMRFLPAGYFETVPGEFSVGVVEKGLFGKFDKYYICYEQEGQILYKEWRDHRMARWIGSPKTHIIRWFPNYQVMADLRLPLLAERALGLCWDKAPYRMPWRGRDRWVYYPVPERIARLVASNLVGDGRFMVMKPADWNA